MVWSFKPKFKIWVLSNNWFLRYSTFSIKSTKWVGGWVDHLGNKATLWPYIASWDLLEFPLSFNSKCANKPQINLRSVQQHCAPPPIKIGECLKESLCVLKEIKMVQMRNSTVGYYSTILYFYKKNDLYLHIIDFPRYAAGWEEIKLLYDALNLGQQEPCSYCKIINFDKLKRSP